MDYSQVGVWDLVNPIGQNRLCVKPKTTNSFIGQREHIQQDNFKSIVLLRKCGAGISIS
jgi:hypothetical protein